MKSAAEELDFLRHLFRSTLEAYGATVEAKLARLKETVASEAERKKLSAGRVHDARDMVTLIRTLEIKPEKGRRRDLKQIEAAVNDLARIVDDWQL